MFVDIDDRACVHDDPRIATPSICSTWGRADLDGDGRPDDVAFYLAGDDTHRMAPVLWTAELRTAAGRRAKAELAAILPPNAPQVLATGDANGDGRADAFVKIGNGASTTWIGLLLFDGTTLRSVVLEPMLLIGGSVRHGDAIECRNDHGVPQLVHLQVSDYVALDRWDVVELVYEWSSGIPHLAYTLGSRFSHLLGEPWPPELGRRYYGLNC